MDLPMWNGLTQPLHQGRFMAAEKDFLHRYERRYSLEG